MAPPLSNEIRERIIALKKAGYKIVDICKETGVTRRTVYIWIRRWQQGGTVEAKHRQNYERRTKPEEDAALIAAHCLDPNLTTRQTAALYNISMHTVRRRLKEAVAKGILSQNQKIEDGPAEDNNVQLLDISDSRPPDESACSPETELYRLQKELEVLTKKNTVLEKKNATLMQKKVALKRRNWELERRNAELEKLNEALNAELCKRLLTDTPRQMIEMAFAKKQKKKRKATGTKGKRSQCGDSLKVMAKGYGTTM